MTATPTKPEHIEDVLGENGLDATAKAALKSYVDDAITTGVKAQAAEQAQAVLADFLREQKAVDGARPDVAATRPHNKFHNPRAAGAALDGKFEGAADLFATLRGERLGHQAAVNRMGELRNAYSSLTPADGGFLVPEEYRAELLRVGLEQAVVRGNGARIIPMSVPRISWPVLDSTSNASSVHGGIIGYWGEEGAALTASSPTFGRVTLDVHKLTGYAEIPNELLADSSPSLAPLVDEIFPEGLNFFEDYAFISGNGVGQPLGFLNADALVTVSKESSQAADTVLWKNIVKMYSRMLPTSLGKAVWIINPNVLPELLTMTLNVKNVAGTENVGGSAVGMTYDSLTGKPAMTLLGRPVVITEKVPSIGDLGDITFVDLSYYLVGDRQQVTAATSEHFKFSSDTTAYRIISRVDGRPGIMSAITPKVGSSTVSPFVQLEAR